MLMSKEREAEKALPEPRPFICLPSNSLKNLKIAPRCLAGPMRADGSARVGREPKIHSSRPQLFFSLVSLGSFASGRGWAVPGLRPATSWPGWSVGTSWAT